MIALAQAPARTCILARMLGCTHACSLRAAHACLLARVLCCVVRTHTFARSHRMDVQQVRGDGGGSAAQSSSQRGQRHARARRGRGRRPPRGRVAMVCVRREGERFLLPLRSCAPRCFGAASHLNAACLSGRSRPTWCEAAVAEEASKAGTAEPTFIACCEQTAVRATSNGRNTKRLGSAALGRRDGLGVAPPPALSKAERVCPDEILPMGPDGTCARGNTFEVRPSLPFPSAPHFPSAISFLGPRGHFLRTTTRHAPPGRSTVKYR